MLLDALASLAVAAEKSSRALQKLYEEQKAREAESRELVLYRQRYVCPRCGQDRRFLEILTHCVVRRWVDGALEHAETEDWDTTGDTRSEYVCPSCGLRAPRGGLNVVADA